MDQTTIWLVVLAIVVLALGCCVVVALRQVTVLRESLNFVTSQIGSVKEDQRRGKAVDAEQHLLQQQLSEQREELREFDSRLLSVEEGVKENNTHLFEIQRQAQSGVTAVNPVSTEEYMRKEETTVSGLNDAKAEEGNREVSQIYEEILSTLKAQASTPGLSPGAGEHHMMSSNNAVAVSFPPRLTVYREVASGIYSKGQFQKYFHSLQTNPENVDDVELRFTAANGTETVTFCLSELQQITIDSDQVLPDGVACSRVEIIPLRPRQSGRSVVPKRRQAFQSVDEVEESGSSFVFRVSVSPAVDEWVSFLTKHGGNCLISPTL